MYYYQQKYNKPVLVGGLLYPLGLEYSHEVQNSNNAGVFGFDHSRSTFSVDGIDLSGLESLKTDDEKKTTAQLEYMKEKEKEFIQRLKKRIDSMSEVTI